MEHSMVATCDFGNLPPPKPRARKGDPFSTVHRLASAALYKYGMRQYTWGYNAFTRNRAYRQKFHKGWAQLVWLDGKAPEDPVKFKVMKKVLDLRLWKPKPKP